MPLRVRLTGSCSGDAQRPPDDGAMGTLEDLVFLHGFLGSPADWEAVGRALLDRRQTGAIADRNARLVAPPLFLGMGDAQPDVEDEVGQARPTIEQEARPEQEDRRRGPSLSLAALADAIAARREPSRRPRTLVGYSLGGRVALHLAIRHPALVRRLVLVSTSPGIEDPAEREARALLDTRRAEELRADPVAFLRAWVSQPLFGYDEVAQAAEARRRHIADPALAARVVEELSPGRQPSMWDVLPSLPMPVTWIAGDRDSAYVASSRAAAALCARGQLRIVGGAGHAVHIDAPAALAAILHEAVALGGRSPAG